MNFEILSGGGLSQAADTQISTQPDAKVDSETLTGIHSLCDRLFSVVETCQHDRDFPHQQLSVLVRIRDCAFGLTRQIFRLRNATRSIYMEYEYDERTSRNTIKKKKSTYRCNMSNLRPLACRLRLLELIFKLISTGTFVTKRDIYYKHKRLFGSQSTVDSALTALCGFLRAPRTALNITSTSRGSVAGPLVIQMSSGDVNCMMQPVTITDAHVASSVSTTTAEFVLVVEKDTVFQALLKENFHGIFPTGILVTGRGFPDLVTRKFLKLLQSTLFIPIFCFVDCDPHGLHIFLTYKFGSKTKSRQIEGNGSDVVVDSIQLIGLKPSHIFEYDNIFHRIPFKRSDDSTLDMVIRRAQDVNDIGIFNEAKSMKEHGVKVEIEALSAHGPGFVIQYLLDCQNRLPWYLSSSQIPKSTPFTVSKENVVPFTQNLSVDSKCDDTMI